MGADGSQEPRFTIEESRRSGEWKERLAHFFAGFVLIGGVFFIVIGLVSYGVAGDELRALQWSAMIASVIGAAFGVCAALFRGAAWRTIGAVLEHLVGS